jgi:hypothetical protein
MVPLIIVYIQGLRAYTILYTFYKYTRCGVWFSVVDVGLRVWVGVWGLGFGAWGSGVWDSKNKSIRSTQWSARISIPPNLEGYVTKFVPREALNLIARGKLTLDESIVLHRVDAEMPFRAGLFSKRNRAKF